MLDAEGQQVAGGELGRLGVPSGVRGLVAQRLARLAESGRTRTHRSVGSRTRIHVRRGRRGDDADEERVLDVLEEAVHAGLVREGPSRVGAYMFSHALVRQTLYEGLTRGPPRDCTVVWVTRSRRSTSAAPIRRSPSLRTTTSRRRLSAASTQAIEYAAQGRLPGNAVARVRGRQSPLHDGARCARCLARARCCSSLRAPLCHRRGGVAYQRCRTCPRDLLGGCAARPAAR